MDTLRPLPSDLVELRKLRSLLSVLRQQLAASIADADHKFRALTALKHKRFTMDLASIAIGETTPPPAILRMDELVPYLPPEHTQFIAEFLKQAGQREQLREQRELDLAMSDELEGTIADSVAAGMNGDDARRTLSRLFSYFGHERDLAELSVGLSTVREAIIALESRVCHELDARAIRDLVSADVTSKAPEQAGAVADQATAAELSNKATDDEPGNRLDEVCGVLTLGQQRIVRYLWNRKHRADSTSLATECGLSPEPSSIKTQFKRLSKRLLDNDINDVYLDSDKARRVKLVHP